MKNILPILLGIILTPVLGNATVEYSKHLMQKQKIYSVQFADNHILSADDVVNDDNKTIEAKLGHKLSLKQKMVLQLAKFQLKKAKKQGKLKESWESISSDNTDTDYWLGFILGLLLGLIGLLIALLFGNQNCGKGAVYGFGLWVLILLLVAYA